MSDMIPSDQEQMVQAKMALDRREMLRQSKDIIRVYNPLDMPFRFMWDGFWHTIPSKKTKDIERYLANHFRKKITEYIVGQEMIQAGEKMLKARKKPYLDKYEENTEVWDKTPRLNDPTRREQIRDIVIIGLVEEYGMELPVDNAQPAGPVFGSDDELLDQQPIRVLSAQERESVSTPTVDEVSQ